MKAKVAYMYGPGDLRVQEVEVPKLKPNQVLVKVGACGICGSDVECFEGLSAEGRYDLGPYTPGHEWGGEIVEIGSQVTTLKPGNKATGDCVMRCGVCANCKDGLMPSACLNMREAGFRPDSPGGMGEYMVIEEQYVHRIPDSWTFEDGGWVETFSIGYFGIWGNGGFIDAADIALILGAGPIGLSAAMVAATSGARTIVIDPTDRLVEQIEELTDGRMGTVVVECSGNDAAIASLFDISGHSARVRLLGHSIGRKIPIEIGKTIWRTLDITGSGGTKNFGQRTIRFMDRIRDTYDFAALNTHHFPFRKIHEAFDVATHDKENALKVMLTF
jgi:threonine dehydrogenase-like Zn-dependent dehydrogenase